MTRVALAILGLVLFGSALLAQGLPGTRAAAAGRAGWEAIRAGRNQDAAAAFAEAIAAEPRDPSLYLGAGLAAHLLGQPTQARQSLEQALAIAPGYTTASLLLGEILYRGSDLDGAIRVYEAALILAPQHDGLTRRLAEWKRESALHSRFFQSNGSHFTVLFEGPSDEQLAARAIELLEAAYWRIGTTFYTFPEQVITVVLYTQEQFRDITRSPDWAAAVYDGRIRVPMRGALTRLEELERVLAHEFTHVLVRTIAPQGVPTWLNEGLAVLFEAKGHEWADETMESASRRLPYAKLNGSFAGFTGPEARLAYAQSALGVQQLIDQVGMPTLVALLQDLARGETFERAFERRALVPYEAFVEGLEARP
jgi:tetratricopeptide (TPR) repeat protein